MRTSRRQESFSAFLFLLPDVAGLILFAFVPIVLAVYISLTQWNGYTQQLFVGLKNYTDLFQDAEFGKSLLTTLEYATVFVATMTVLSLCCALIINSVKGIGQEIYRTMIFTPYAISAVIAAMVWTFLYQVPKGYFNSFLMSIGLDKMLFLGSPEQALFSVIAVSLWATLGYNMIIFMAAIKDVPAELYEAAEIDGANFFERFKTITLPMLKNTSLFIIVMSTIAALQVFDQIKIMTDGGPAKATNVTVYYIYKMGFTVGQLGYASATAVLLFIAISIFTLFQFRLLNGGKTKDEA
jgi:ABC-type sugar transport system permease subunit